MSFLDSRLRDCCNFIINSVSLTPNIYSYSFLQCCCNIDIKVFVHWQSPSPSIDHFLSSTVRIQMCKDLSQPQCRHHTCAFKSLFRRFANYLNTRSMTCNSTLTWKLKPERLLYVFFFSLAVSISLKIKERGYLLCFYRVFSLITFILIAKNVIFGQ